MKYVLFLIALTALASSHAGPVARFEMRVKQARVFTIRGGQNAIDLDIVGVIQPGPYYGSFHLAAVTITSPDDPALCFSHQASNQIGRLFWEVATHEIMRGTYQLTTVYELGRLSGIEVSSHAPYLTVDSTPLQRKDQSEPVLIQEIHLFTNRDGVVESVNAKYVHPGVAVDYNADALDIETPYLDLWHTGQIKPYIGERGERTTPPPLSSCLAFIATAAAIGTSVYLLFF